MKETFTPTMSYEDARKVLWRFSGLRQPMGELFDRRSLDVKDRITAKDLVWAIETDWVYQNIREAARTLLAEWLTLPQTVPAKAPPGPEVVYGSRYLIRMERANFALVFAFVGFVVGFTIPFLFNMISYISTKGLSLAEAIVVPVLVAATGLMVYRFVTKMYRDSKAFRVGREGEDAVAERMMAVLDGRWTIFRNWLFPDRRYDIDIILVGPGGVYAIEVKTYSEKARSDVLFKVDQKGRKGTQKLSADKQAESNAISLRSILNQKGIAIRYVKAVVAFPAFQPQGFTADGAEVWHMVDLNEKLFQLNSGANFDEAVIKNSVEVLKALNRQR